MGIYFIFVIGVGYFLKNKMKSSTDFFLAGRAIPAWVAGIAFLSANLGAQEVIGMGASGAKYGITTCQFYWMAVPAMIFVGLFMMPFYYGSRARSVPEYLKLRYDEKTRAVNAASFAVMTVFSSGVSMYAMGDLFHLLLGWNFTMSVWISAAIVLAYTFLGGLASAIYNEVLQFFLIVIGFLPLVFIGLRAVGGWEGLKRKLEVVSVNHGYAPTAYTEAWRFTGHAAANPMGVEWIGLTLGLGFVLNFGYWGTDFLVIQRAMAADSMEAAKKTPLIAASLKMLFPVLVILPGMIALVAGAGLSKHPSMPAAQTQTSTGATIRAAEGEGIIPPQMNVLTGKPRRNANGQIILDYDLATPMMLVHFYRAGTGLLGLGLTALLASFMSGMAGNVTAFNTVWTYDLYQGYINKGASDRHYLWMGRFATVFGVLLSIAAAYVAASFNNIMDLLQLVFAFVNAPLFATFALGMFWRRTTGHGAFCGLIAGTVGAAVHHGLTLPIGSVPGIKGGFIHVVGRYHSDLAQTFWTAIVAFSTCLIVTVAVSLLTQPRPEQELHGLVYSLTVKPASVERVWYRRPTMLAMFLLMATVALNIIFF